MGDMQGPSSFQIKAGRKPGLYNEASSSSSSAQSHIVLSSSASPAAFPRLPSAFSTSTTAYYTTTAASPLLKSSSLKRARGVSSTMTVITSPAGPSTSISVPAAAAVDSRYAGLASVAPTTPTRPTASRQPSRSERMLRATLGTLPSPFLFPRLLLTFSQSIIGHFCVFFARKKSYRPAQICVNRIESFPLARVIDERQ